MTSPPAKFAIPGGGTLRGDAAASYLRMRAAGLPAGGIDAWSRTYAQQAELRRRYEAGLGPLAAKPNANAPHIKGVAIDSHTTTAGKYAPSAAHKWLTQGGDGSDVRKGEKIRANGFGFIRTVNTGPRRERWHFAYDPAKDTKAAADLAARLKALGFKDVKTFQRSKGLAADGKAGPQTWTALLAAQPARVYRLGDRVLKRGDKGADVAELSALLKRAGYAVGTPLDAFGPMVEAAVRAAQKSAGLLADGKVGAKTIAALRAVPDAPDPPKEPPVPVPTPTTAALMLGIANCQSYDGQKSEASYRARAKIMAAQGWTVVALCETTQSGRTWMLDELYQLTGHRWATWTLAQKSVALIWDDRVWKPGTRRVVDLKTAFGHGGVLVPLTHRETGLSVDVASIHGLPGSIATSAQKDAGIKRLATLARGWGCVLAGDFARNSPRLSGWIRATPVIDTMDRAGEQTVDAAFIRGKIGAGTASVVDPGALSDHKWLTVPLILGDLS